MTAMLDPEALASWTMPPARLRDWAATAPAGDTLTYARGVRLTPKCATAEAARKLADDQYVTLVQRKHGVFTDYLMQRRRPAKASIGRPNKFKKSKLDGDMAKLLRLLRGLVRQGWPVPRNEVLAKQAGLRGPDQASYALKKLVAAGLVKSRVVDTATGARVVTIVATGAETAMPAGRP